MLERIRRKIDLAWFNFRCRDIYNTPPIQCDSDSDVLVVSQLHHPDVIMYLLAIKSFAHYIQPRGFVIVDDGLLPKDKDVLVEHLGSIQFVPSKSVPLESCPAGGCWERLLTLSEVNKEHYVIQLDADTLTLVDPAEVRQCVAEARSFTMGTQSGRCFVGFDDASRNAFTRDPDHVQILAERALGEYPGKEHLKYVRGCAGFTGFAKGCLSREKIEEFSGTVERLIGGNKWREWGSEQVTSNYMVANSPDSIVLPIDRYPFWAPGVDIERAAVVHFFGTFRYTQGTYIRHSRRVIANIAD